MFSQKLFRRMSLVLIVISTILIAITFGVGHLLNQPVIVAYVDQPADRTLFAYIVDIRHRINIPLELPSELTYSIWGSLPYDPTTFFVDKNVIGEDGRVTARRLYRYDLLTKERTTVYESNTQSGQRSLAIEINGFVDRNRLLVADKTRRAIVLVNQRTRDAQVLWQGEELQVNLTDYLLRAFRSPFADKYAILDGIQQSVVIVSGTGEILSQFSITGQPQMWLSWLSDEYVMVTPMSFNLAPSLGIYNTVTGQPETDLGTVARINVQPLFGCEDPGTWISFVQLIGPNEFQAFTMDLSTGAMYEQATYETEASLGPPPMRAYFDCMVLLQVVPGADNGMSDVYLTTLTGAGLKQILSNVVPGYFIDEYTFTYVKPDGNDRYELHALSLVDFTTQLLLSDLPTSDAAWTPSLLDRGWYIFLEDRWVRSPRQFPYQPGNPVLYYDVHSQEAHVLTPPGVRIQYYIVLS